MKTKKVLILILLVIITISATACVDKDSVEYIYNIRRFVGEYENVDPGIGIYAGNSENPNENSTYLGCVNEAITTTGFTSVSNPNDKKFIEKDIAEEEVEFFNSYIKILSKTIEVKKKEVKFVESSITQKIIDSVFSEQQTDDILGHFRTLIIKKEADDIFYLNFGYHTYNTQSTIALLLISKSYTNKNGDKRILKIMINYQYKE